MKFEKFVKSLASTGTIYERENGEHWLASNSVFMKIPNTIRSITATEITKMPSSIEKIISQSVYAEPVLLTAAYMPVANGNIKDCQREYRTVNDGICCRITNDDYALLDKNDITEIIYHYNLDNDCRDVKALVVKNLPVVPDDDDEIVGIIFPIIIS